MAGQGVKTSFGPIARAIQSAIIEAMTELTGGEWSDDKVFFSRIDLTPRWSQDDVVLRVTGARPYPGFYEGHGLIAPGLVRAVIAEIRTRSSTDISDRVDVWLLDVQIPREDAVITAVTGLRPIDSAESADPNVLVIEEIRVGNLSDYRDELQKFPPADKTYGSSYVVFEVAYCAVAADLPGTEE